MGAYADDFSKGYDAYKAGDYKTALKLWKPIAEQDDAIAQLQLGLMYYNGSGVLQDYKEAAKWYRLAAEQGVKDAQFSLGVMHYNGSGVIEDLVYSHMWLNIAASLGEENAPEARRITSRKMTPSQIEKAQELARQCLKKNYKDC